MDNQGSFREQAATSLNPKWPAMIHRAGRLDHRTADIRSEFARDYTRILHSTAYRRLKHKTQVYFSPQNDHICTRIEHVNLVESVSYTIANYLGLNTELTKAISVGHDLGHAPFGHLGEDILRDIYRKELGEDFWHEKNGLHFVDDIELLEDNEGYKNNLCLTYAVRDGIIAHCGEVDENGLLPRAEAIDLGLYSARNSFPPYTWEGCVVKLADKIAYLGRDIEDALTLNILDRGQLKELQEIMKKDTVSGHLNYDKINNTVIMHDLIVDLCQNSDPRRGVRLSAAHLRFIDEIKRFNYRHIYGHPRLKPYRDYARLILDNIYRVLKDTYQGEDTPKRLAILIAAYPELGRTFSDWIACYWDLTPRAEGALNLRNKVIYDIRANEAAYRRAILDFIAGMTDQYAVRAFQQIISF